MLALAVRTLACVCEQIQWPWTAKAARLYHSPSGFTCQASMPSRTHMHRWHASCPTSGGCWRTDWRAQGWWGCGSWLAWTPAASRPPRRRRTLSVGCWNAFAWDDLQVHHKCTTLRACTCLRSTAVLRSGPTQFGIPVRTSPSALASLCPGNNVRVHLAKLLPPEVAITLQAVPPGPHQKAGGSSRQGVQIEVTLAR